MLRQVPVKLFLWGGLVCLPVIALANPSGLRETGADWEDNAETGFVGGVNDGTAASPAKGGLLLAPSGENLLADPGFDQDPNAVKQTPNPYGGLTNPTNGWEHNGLSEANGAVRRAKDARSSGTAWELVDTMAAGEPALLQRVSFKPEYRGRRFVFSLWARTAEGQNDSAMIALKWRGKGSWRGDCVKPIVVTPEWREYSVEDAMPEDADEIGVVIGPSSYPGTGSVLVDDARLYLASYRATGSYTSAVRDMGADGAQVWKARWRGSAPPKTSVALSLRTGRSANPDATWSPWEQMDGNPDVELRLPPGRYVQCQVMLRTESPEATPVVNRIEVWYGAHLGRVRGRVRHSRTGAPVCAAAVSAGGQTVLTDAKGALLLALPAGAWRMSVRSLHYLDSEPMEITIEEGKEITRDVPLKPDPNWWTFRCDSQRQACSALSGRMGAWEVVWRYPLGRERSGQVIVEDVTGDRIKEILVAAGGALTAYDLHGNQLWQTRGWELGSMKGVYDILGNGQKQIVCVSEGWWPYANGAFTVVDGRNGSVLSRVDTWPDAGDIGHGRTFDYLHGSFSVLSREATVVADLDGDGRLEIMAHPNYHSSLLAYHFHDGIGNVKPLWKTEGRFKYDLYLYPLFAADVDGDGKLEIVFHDNDLIRLFNGADGRQKAEVDLGCTGGLVGAMARADVDADGRQEIFLIPHLEDQYKRNTVACAGWDGKGLAKRWLRDFDAVVRPQGSSSEALSALIANVDNDKAIELTIQVGEDVRVLNATDGAEKHRIPGALLKTVEDVNGDGIGEIVVTRQDKTLFFNACDGKMAERSLSYPPGRGWADWGDGELSRWQWGTDAALEIVNKEGKVKARMPGAPFMADPIAADLEGDGRMEILVRDASGRVRVFDGAASPPKEIDFPEWRCDGVGGVTRGCGITACDVNGDGKREIVLIRKGQLKVADCRGKELFSSQEGQARFPIIGDFNGDGVKDIAWYTIGRSASFGWNGKWTAFDLKNGKVLWEAGAPDTNEVAAWDVDGDGRDELTGKHGPVFMISGADGHTMWKAFRKEMCALGLGAFADLDGDGQMEALITGEYTNTAWRANGENFWWIGWSSGGAKEHYGAVADVNGDGALDLGLSSNHGVFYCVDGRDARELWTYKIPEKITLTHPAAADLDGDGKVEFVFGTNTGLLVMLNGEDGSVAQTMDLGHPVGPPIFADVDNDGDGEILFCCNSEICCVDGGRNR